MSNYDPDRTFSKMFINVPCPCGKTLRAKIEMAGGEIRCWSCHQMVRVPVSHSSAKVIRALGRGWDNVFRAESFGLMFLAAAVLTGLLSVPYAGIALVTGAFVVLGWGYGEIIRRSGRWPAHDDDPPEPRPSRSQLTARSLAAAALGLGLAAPWFLAPGGVGHSVRLSGLTLVVLALVVLALPIALVACFATDRRGPIPWRDALGIVRWHPAAVALALALIPLAALLSELFLFLTCWHFGLISFLLLDLMPRPEYHLQLFHLPLDVSYGFGSSTDVPMLQMYLHRLREGYTLLGAIPTSLPMPKDLTFSAWSGSTENLSYFLIRIGLTLIPAMMMLVALTLQAHWLGLIVALDSRLPARTPGTDTDTDTGSGSGSGSDSGSVSALSPPTAEATSTT